MQSTCGGSVVWSGMRELDVMAARALPLAAARPLNGRRPILGRSRGGARARSRTRRRAAKRLPVGCARPAMASGALRQAGRGAARWWADLRAAHFGAAARPVGALLPSRVGGGRGAHRRNDPDGVGHCRRMVAARHRVARPAGVPVHPRARRGGPCGEGRRSRSAAVFRTARGGRAAPGAGLLRS